ncbi:MAG: hypothetical protein IKO41_15295 [Lachnospiraceae bacterium]|nr:hypothetical protein [Lachnospiraceae bacterium]
MLEYHNLDPYSVPKDKVPLYVNEPNLVDITLQEYFELTAKPNPEDNVRIYVPLDLNAEAILRRLDYVIYRYGESTEENECKFRSDVIMIMA